MKPQIISERNIMFSEGMDNLYFLNIGLILGERRNYVIDTGLGSGSVKPVIEYIRKNAAAAATGAAASSASSAPSDGERRVKPTVVVNTHFHWDHVWGNSAFEENGVPAVAIAAHVKCRELLKTHWERDTLRCEKYMDGDVKMRLPDITFNDALYFPDDGVRVFFSPGHTCDCVSVYDEIDRVLYAGDNIGDTDSMIVPEIETDTETFLKTMCLYESIDFNICISGHNAPQPKEIIRRIINKLGYSLST